MIGKSYAMNAVMQCTQEMDRKGMVAKPSVVYLNTTFCLAMSTMQKEFLRLGPFHLRDPSPLLQEDSLFSLDMVPAKLKGLLLF